MVIHRDQRRADARDVLDEFEKWLLQERSTQECTAAAYTARGARLRGGGGPARGAPPPLEQTDGQPDPR